MGWGKFLDGHVEKGQILSGLLFADPSTPRVEPLVPFEEKDHLGVVWDLVDKFWMLPHVSVELQPQEAITCFEEAQGHSPLSSCRRSHGFEADDRHLCSQGDDVQLFETDDLAFVILHEDDITAGFFAQVFLIGVSEPHRQCISNRIEEQLYFRFHIHQSPEQRSRAEPGSQTER